MSQPTLKLASRPATEGAVPEHTAERTSSTTLNHLRGPSAALELTEMRAERDALIDRVRKLTRDIADVELAQLVSA